MSESTIDFAALKSRAKQACSVAYAPYSRFRVGAAVSAASGEVFSGCNVENASYGLTQCAERNAIAAAVAAGMHDLHAVLIYTPGERAHPPCGACRQVIQELIAPAGRIISCCDSEQVKEWTVAGILPEPFKSEDVLRP